ncbi:hypothetical protein [Pacificoceanicola onchidii]|uniref:hypothetical protein n=1 Tax=Pacificoceanicola onchidii TaxID=2562685 RepID=UPI0010A435AD|nr:hypothetical protein [Pacificoceanicola onchidii]
MTRPFTMLALLLLAPASGATAQVLESASDATIRRSLCLGQLCPDDPTGTFSLDTAGGATLRLHDGNTRIDFDDSTTNPSFPQNKWSLVANDTAPSGADYFAIEDVTGGGVRPFVVEAGAPANALYVADDGKIGLGTMLPEADLHMISANVSKIRMQETSGADWDINIGSTGFGLLERPDVNEPFFVETGAPTYAFWIEDTGDLGFGTNTPEASVDIIRSDNSARIRVRDTGSSGAQEMFAMVNNGGSYFTLDNTDAGTTWYFVHENAAPNRFIISDAVADGPEMSLTADGDLTIPGQLFTAGSCAAGCDRVFDEDYPLPTIPEQAAMMRERKHLPNVGPTPEDGPFNITKMTGGMLNELEKAHLYIGQLHDQNAALEARVEALEALLLKQ